jgi:alpha-L-fucosidase
MMISGSGAGPICEGIPDYSPTSENIASRERFSDDRFGVFIHWGVYSMLARGEWVMNNENIKYADYSMFPGGFYPSHFNAAEWVGAIKASGARYITITARHHDGFSMFGTEMSPYNIVDATPFGRDILKELAGECRKQGIMLNFYYSLLDWGRGDYPQGSSGKGLGKNPAEADYGSYLDFMCGQLRELLTGYGPVGCIWFDGDWDQIAKGKDGKAPEITFDWHYGRLYSLIHSVQSSCLVANNHHREPVPGEDVQIFERDVPGENSAGYSRTAFVSEALPLETCKTMNGSWGYDVSDRNYKSPAQLIRILVSTAGRNANLLLNIGPQPDGRIPAEALERLSAIGKWMSANGETIYGTRSTLLKPQKWGVVTHKEDKIFLHVMKYPDGGMIRLPFSLKAKSVTVYGSSVPVAFKRGKNSFTVEVPENADCSVDYIIQILK